MPVVSWTVSCECRDRRHTSSRTCGTRSRSAVLDPNEVAKALVSPSALECRRSRMHDDEVAGMRCPGAAPAPSRHAAFRQHTLTP